MEKINEAVLKLLSKENAADSQAVERVIVTLGDASELTMGNGCTSFENFGCKWN